MRTLILLSSFIILWGCSKSDNDNCFDINETFTLKYGETKVSCDGTIEVRLDSLEDSRCPRNVVCVWAGVAAVHTIFEYNNSSQLGYFLNGDGCHDMIGACDTSILVGDVYFELLEVAPYPQDDYPDDDEYNLTFRAYQ